MYERNALRKGHEMIKIYRLPPVFYGDHVARALPENEQAVSRYADAAEHPLRNHRVAVELDELGFDELRSDADYYATSMRSAGYDDQGVIASARATVRALDQQGRPA
jgi:hypothetical protein